LRHQNPREIHGKSENHLRARVTIRPPAIRDGPAFLAAVRRSRALHRRWVSPPDTRKKFEDYSRRMVSDSHRGFLVVLCESGDLAGTINLNNIIHGSLQGAFLVIMLLPPTPGRV